MSRRATQTALLLSHLALAGCPRDRVAPPPLPAVVAVPPAPSAVVSAAPPASAALAPSAPAAPPGPRVFQVKGASAYDFTLEVGSAPAPKGDEAVGPPGVLTVLVKGTSEVVQRLTLAALAPRAAQASYEPEILVEDYDFDGHPDFALHTGDHGPYGAPTYSIFLFAPAARAFAFSAAFSALSEQSLDPLVVDRAARRIRVSSKSGCCIHGSEAYELHKGTLSAVERETVDASAPDGCTNGTAQATATLYDPTTNAWTAAASMTGTRPRARPRAAAPPDAPPPPRGVTHPLPARGVTRLRRPLLSA